MEISYEQFSTEKCRALQDIQERFKEKFKIDQYKHWFYDADLELLRLYNSEEDQVFFKYIPVGTFSFKSETWMWSWFNEHSVEPNKHNLLVIRDFGADNGYLKLTDGIFTADEFDCWEFTSICLDWFNGIGAYKVKTGNLEKYMVIVAVVSEDAADVIQFNQKKVNCGIHGFSRPAFVCQHLNLQEPKGFEETFETSKGMDLGEEDDFQAWCNECEKIRVKHDGWNDKSEQFAKIKLICESCYFELKDFNRNESV